MNRPASSRPRRLVAIGFAESLAAIEACWDLLDSGHAVVALARRGARVALHHDHRVTVLPITPPEQSITAARSDLEQLLTGLAADVFLPLDDAALWLAGSATLDGTVLAAPPPDCREVALDKRLQLRLAAQAGLPVPVTRKVEDGEVPADLRFPVVVKPALAVQRHGDRLARAGAQRCEGPADLRAALRRSEGPALVQPCLTGRGEGVFGHATATAVHAWSAHRRLRMMHPDGSGSSACTAAQVDADVVQGVERLVRTVGWRGPFMVELLRTREGPWFIELNGRLWGSLALSAARGYRYATWAVQGAMDADFAPRAPEDPPMCTARHLGRELVHLGFVLRGPRSRSHDAWPGRLATARQLLRMEPSTHWYNHRRGLGRVLVADTVNTLRAQLAGRAS